VPLRTLEVDVAIIGAGTAGLTALSAARKRGASLALIEGGPYGTTCARVGCMPSKLLIAAGEAAHAAQRTAAFGVHVEGAVRIDGREVMARVKAERDRFVGFVLSDVERIPEAERLRGHARFVDDHTLAVGDHTRVEARSVVIASGSRPSYPESFGQLGDRLVTSDDVFDWDDLPKSVAVIGPGAIGLELGQALYRLGVRVAVFGRGGRFGPLSDPQVRDYAIGCCALEFSLEPDAQIADMRRAGSRVAIRRKDGDGKELTEHFDRVLAATGRKSNVDTLGIGNTTLELDKTGVPFFDPRTARARNAAGNAPIFIAGDADEFIPLLHEAADEGRIAGENAARLAAGKPPVPGMRRAPLGIVFTDPQIAIVGGGFRALKEGSFAIGEAGFEDQGRARILLRNSGLLHVYGEIGSGRFLGAEMIAPDAEHLGHLLAWALQNEMTVGAMLEMPFYHPVIEEGLRTALQDLARQLAPRSPAHKREA
jgi:dihydrolipoamide dehydrogenase